MVSPCFHIQYHYFLFLSYRTVVCFICIGSDLFSLYWSCSFFTIFCLFYSCIYLFTFLPVFLLMTVHTILCYLGIKMTVSLVTSNDPNAKRPKQNNFFNNIHAKSPERPHWFRGALWVPINSPKKWLILITTPYTHTSNQSSFEWCSW